MGELQLRYHPKVVQVDIKKLDGSIRKRIRSAIEKKLKSQPEQFAKPLAYTRQGLWSLRVGSWRVVFAFRGDALWILRIGHRREVYNDLESRQPTVESAD